MGKRKDGEPQQIANAGSRIALLGDWSQPEVLSSHLKPPPNAAPTAILHHPKLKYVFMNFAIHLYQDAHHSVSQSIL